MVRLFIVLTLLCPSLAFGQTTYYNDIKPILKKHCTSCHSDNEIGPMPLETYEEVSSYATMIKFVTNIKLMPPFKADHVKVAYKNERSISQEEIALIEAWIEGGLQEGNPDPKEKKEQVVEPKKFDEVICMNESFSHYGIYYDQYQAFVLPLDNEHPKNVSQVEILPGNKEIVRSAYLSIAQTGDARTMDDWDPKYGFYAYGSLGFEPIFPNWYTWIPNTKGLTLSNNETLLLPDNSELILHLHYGPYGEVQLDSTCIGLTFEEDVSDRHQLQNVPLLSTEFLQDTFYIEKNLKKRITSQFYIPEDIQLKSITPLSYLLCQSWEVFAVLPDKSSIPLLSISDWDFHWRERYIFEDYIFLPKGTRIIGTAIYDNTTNNPYNPSDPPHSMKKGPHMFDENFVCYFEFLHEADDRSATIKKPYTVADVKFQKLEFTCNERDEYTIVAYDLLNNESHEISQRHYSKGNHSVHISDFFQNSGRYAISISKSDQLQDVWLFVIK